MLAGLFFGIAACAIWGLIYVIPLFLPEYSPLLISAARYSIYGFTCLFLVPLQWKELMRLSPKDWVLAFSLSFFGSIVYYCCLVVSVNLAGAPVSGMLMCWIPVLVALVANYQALRVGKGVAWKKIAIPLVFILVGIVIANWTEFEYVVNQQHSTAGNFWLGVAAGATSMLLWTWYPIRNARWLLDNKDKKPNVWATAQGLVILPFTVISYFVVTQFYLPENFGPLGPTPTTFIICMLVAGICCCWMAAAAWNEMSQRLPTALAGQLIVFETIFSVIYAMLFRGEWPTMTMVVGMVMLITGVLVALRIFKDTEV